MLAPAPLRRRGSLASCIAAWLLVLAALLGGGAAQATVYNFNGGAVSGCPLTGTVYTCAQASYREWNDAIVIASGYTLKITSNFAASYNQGLSMSSGAKFIVTGDLNLNAINPANLQISGGDIEVGGTFSMGASAHSAVANIAAGAIQLGTDRVTITGNLSSQGVVNISSHSRITGDIRGTVVSTGSPATITGNVTASSKFTLASGSTLAGDITTPVFDMLPSSSRVTGTIIASISMTMGSGNTVTGNISTGTFTMEASGSKVTGNVSAAKTMTMGSGNAVTGNVDTGDLLLQSSSAIITGDARVNWATLEWAGRVTGTIYCKGGTKKNKCDCVTNNSGYQVNTANGPRCEGAAPQTVDHYLITHDGQANSCVPESVTVTACANASCTAPHFADAPSVSLSPGGGLLTFGNSGVANATVTSIQSGDITLALTGAYECYNTGSKSKSCKMAFADKTAFEIEVPAHRSGEVQTPIIRALKPSNDRKACIPAFSDKTLTVGFSCAHSRPATGRDYLRLASQGGDTSQNAARLSCGGMASPGGVAASKDVDIAFDSTGTGKFALAYDDVGEVRLKASYSADGATVDGEGLFIAVPYAFAITVPTPAAPGFVAGKPFAATLTALNAKKGTTRGFDVSLFPTNSGVTDVTLDNCVVDLAKGSISPGTVGNFQGGVAAINPSWSEVGRMGLQARQQGFLGTGLTTTGASLSGTGACKDLGPFVPAYLQVERDPASPARPFDYSGEAIPILVTAKNVQGGTTLNYQGEYSEDVTLDAALTTGGPGAWSPAGPKIAAAAFKEGQGKLAHPYVLTKAVKPAKLAVRATSASATSKDTAGAEKLQTEVRLGRLRLFNNTGSEKAKLQIQLAAEYWTGSSWIRNDLDNFTTIPHAAFALSPTPQTMTVAKTFAVTNVPLALENGAASLFVQATAGGPGWVDIAINLDQANGKDNACAGTHPPSDPGLRPWLRPQSASCRTGPTDPSARATFGIFLPGSRSVIHVREVFN
jgi:MSHA biogenesis protein MshQ